MWKKSIDATARWMNLDIKHSQRRYFEALQQRLAKGTRWLDLGCGHQIVPDWAASEKEQRTLVGQSELLVGADLDPAISEHPYLRHRVFARGEALPFITDSFDLVTANMVVEHLDQPDATFTEIKRVLKPGGRVMFHTPNLNNPYVFTASHLRDSIKKPLIRLLESREDKDVFPTHYLANTAAAVNELCSRVGLRPVEVKIGGSIGSLQQLGLLGVLEVPFLKMLSLPAFERWNATIIAVLEKPRA